MRVALRGVAVAAACLGVAGAAEAFNISGSVFEDANYGGGAGRTRAASSGVLLTNARVELFNNAGNFVSSTTTNGSGAYSFNGLANGTYTVRVVNSSVPSSRTGWVAGLLPVQTYRTTATTGSAVSVTDRVGGEVPSKDDAGNGATTLAALTTATTAPQSITTVTSAGPNVTGVDFGFNFDTIVNVNDTGQGSLRQFIVNANTLANTGLAISGQTAGRDVSIFMVSDGAAHAGLRAGITNLLTGGVAVITVATALPSFSQAATTLDGTTQTSNVGNTNAATFGTGGTVGVDAVALGTFAGPEVEIKSGATLATGVWIQAANVTVRGCSIYGFGAVNGEAAIVVDAFAGTLIEDNVLGTSATTFGDPGTTLRAQAGVYLGGATGATIQDNLIGYTRQTGVYASNPTASCTIQGNEIVDVGLDTSDGDGITFNAVSTMAVTANRISGSSSQGVVVTTAPASGNTFTNNTLTGNGVGLPASLVQSPAVAMRSGAASTTIDRNVINANYGAGIQVNNGSTGTVITRNSIFDNGTITARNGGAATGQIGIDLNAAGDDQNVGTAPFVTLNDNGDADAGGNSLANFPILSSVTLSGTNMTVSGYARPGAVIELFVAKADGSGFGEGQTWAATVTEGGTGAGGNDPVADTDAGAGSYGPGAINGVAQGTDNTNKFTFTLPTPGSVTAGARLTATARVGGETSEFSGNATVVALNADLAVTLTDAPDPAPAGGEFLYTVLVTNNGPGTATSCVMRDTLPAGLTLVSANASQGTVSGTSIVIANLGAILSGGTASVEMLVTTSGPGSVTDRAYVSATESDPTPANNVASATTTIANQTTSDTPLTQYKRIHGFVDYAVTGGSLRTQSNNGNPCLVGASSTAALSGIPVTATVTNAYLYWAGSGQTVDNIVTLDGTSLTADRTFTANFDLGGTTYYDFGGFKDVTAQVVAKRNGNYTFAGLTVATGSPYCAAQAVLAGWSLLVIYSDNAVSGKTLVLYDGFDITRNGSASYLLTGIYASAPPEAKASFLVWEGDETLSGASESLTFNGATLSDGSNPATNVYNSTINSLGSTTSYGLDLDTFDVSAQIAQHDVLATAQVSTGPDLVIANAVLLEVKSNVITGHVFEDVNYGGGAGRDFATAAAAAPLFTVGRPNATVELYDASGVLLRTTTTGANGEYGFAGLVDGDYDVRVVNATVTSSRTGATGNEWPVQTYRADATTGTSVAVTDAVGGTLPGSQDSGANPGAANLSTLTAQSVTRAKVITGISVTDVDFGYSFDVVVNRNNAGQGSLRQFLLNANALANTNLAQAGRSPARDNAVFMLADGTARPGLRASYATQFTAGVATIAPTSALPAVSSPAVIDGWTQPGWTSAPIIELNGTSAGAGVDGLALPAGSTTVRGLVINRFGRHGIYATAAGGDTIAGCRIGTNAANTAAAANGGQGILLAAGSANDVIGGTTAGAGNVVATNGAYGIALINSGTRGNAILGNSTYGNAGIGIDLGADGVTANNGTKNVTLPNDEMDSPVFASAYLAAGSLTVAGHVGSAAGQATFANARVEIFKSDNDASGFGEGQTYLGFLTANASGNFSGTIAAAALASGNRITATATDAGNSTSEFGANIVVSSPTIVKRAFDLNNIPIPTGAVIAKGAVVKWLLYVSNAGPIVPDVSLRDVLDPGFAYVPGTLRVTNAPSLCATGTCTSGEEDVILAAALAGTAGTDAVDGDVVSRSGTTVYVGNQNAANAQLDIAANRIYAVVFTVRMQ